MRNKGGEVRRTLAIAVLALALPARAVPSASLPSPPASLAAIPVYLAVELGSHQVLAKREPDRTILPASMTKVMTAYVAFELIAQGKLRPQQVLAVEPGTAAEWSGRGTSMWLEPREQVTVDMLLQGITSASANDASIVLAEGAAGSVAAWLGLMNAEAQRLGMTRSRFGTPNGWPDGGGTRVTAADMITLGVALIERHPELYSRYFGKKNLTRNDVTLVNFDPTIGVVRGADGIKTGHTRESGYSFLGTAARDGRRVMIVIGGARSQAERAAAARDLLEWGFSAWEAKRLFPQGAKVADALVQNGDARRVALVAPRDVSYALPRGEAREVTMRVRYRGPLVAPVAKGRQVAHLEITAHGQPTARVPLVAAENVGEAGAIDRLLNGLNGLLS
jgi:D-alanyl-D-alanine carboxypeptidase (penicillin-binding protein 5/6)